MAMTAWSSSNNRIFDITIFEKRRDPYNKWTELLFFFYLSTYDNDTTADIKNLTVNGYVTVNETGERQNFETTERNVSIKRSYTLVATKSLIVYHDSDGVANITVHASVQEDGQYTISTNGQDTVTPFPSQVKIKSIGDTIIDSNCDVSFVPATNTSYYSITFSLGNWSASTERFCPGTTGTYSYNGYVIPGAIKDANGNILYDQLPNSTSGIMTATLSMYLDDDSDQVYSTNSQTFTVFVPENIKPKIGDMILTPQKYDLLLQNNNSIEIEALDCIPGEGSSIATYTYSGPNVSAISTQSSIVSGRILLVGTLTYTVTVTDTRGRTSSASSRIECHPYLYPSITFNAFRSNSEGVSDNNGRYIACNYTPKFSSVKNSDGEELNSADVQIYYSNKDVSKYTELLHYDTTSVQTTILDSIDLLTYDVYAKITDNFGGAYISNIVTIFSKRILNILKDGSGMAFGKMADTEALLDSAWAINTDQPEQTMQNFTYRNSNLVVNTDTEPNNDTPKNWGSHGNLATTLYDNENQITDQPSDKGFVVNITNGPNASDVHQIWAGQSGSSLSHRDGDSSGWNGSWKTILDSKNYTDYVDNDYINTMSISWNKIVDTPTTLDGYGIVVENIDYIEKPVVLYDSSAGTSGTITLSTDSFANYEYLEICYRVSLGEPGGSLSCNKFIFKAGALVLIDTIDVGGSNGSVVGHISTYMVSENAITPDIKTMWDYKTSARTNNGSNIRIFRILGYK